MKNTKNRTSNKGRTSRLPRAPERNCIIDGVYSNNYFMHAATSHIGTAVKIETAQGAVYEGIFKTFSQDFDVVLELAHSVDKKDPHKNVNSNDIVENLIFNAKDIVYMCAQNVEPEYAFNSNSFQIDSSISKCNGEIFGEKELQPWEDSAPTAEECDLETTKIAQNGWDVHEMFIKNEQFGVQTTYDDSLSNYTCQIDRKDTKDFKEDEARAARIAMEIERNPSSQARASLENGENEEELFAAVHRPGNENESKYVPPAKRQNQHHRVSGGNFRGNYSSNGNQRSSYSIPEVPGRLPKNSAASLPRYHHQGPQQYHQSTYNTPHSSSGGGRDCGNRSSSENKNQMSAPPLSGGQPSQNVYSSNLHQQRSFLVSNVVPNTAVSQQQQHSKSQRTSPVSANPLPNGTEYQAKSLPPVTQSCTHQQYHIQNQQHQHPSNNGGNVTNSQQRKQHHPHHHASSRVRDDQINELKKFGMDFNLPHDSKHKDSDPPQKIQVVTNRNKSPPLSHSQGGPVPGNVVSVTIVTTLPQNKYNASTPITPQSVMDAPQAVTIANTQGSMPPPPSAAVTVVTTQGIKPSHLMVLSQQTMNIGHGDSPVMMQHQPHMPSGSHRHPQASLLPSFPSQQSVMLQQQPPLPSKSSQKGTGHQMGMHQSPTVLPPMQQPSPGSVQIQQHPPPSQQQHVKTVINTSGSNAPTLAPAVTTGSPPPTSNATQGQQSCSQLQVVHLRPPQRSLKGHQMNTSPETLSQGSDTSEMDGPTKDSDAGVDDVSQRVKNVRLNPDAKEYVPAVKSFIPASRSPSTPTQSRPHTPQTPSSYNIHPANTPVPTGISMVMPTYVVAATPAGYMPSQAAATRIRKAPMNSHRAPEFHPSNIPVSAVTGQPLLAPPLPLAQSHLGHGTSFSVPAYHHPPLATTHYSPLQMIRMVQQGGMVPIVPSTIYSHDTGGSNATAMYVNQGSGAAVAMAPHNPHLHHPQQHLPPSTAPSPSQTPQGPSQSHTPNNYQHPPLAAQSASPYPPIMCPVIQAPPNHGPPHHMVAAPAQQHAMQQYLSQHPSVTHQPQILSIIPHSCS